MESKGSQQIAAIVEQVAVQFSQVYFVYHITQQRLEYLNPSFENLWEASPELFQENPAALLSYVHPEDMAFLKDQFQKLLRDKEREKVEFRIMMPDQREKWVCLSAHLFEEAGAAYIGGYVEDMTKQKSYADVLQKYAAKKNSTLEVLSHDLAAPFANIQGMVDLLEQHMPEESTEIKQLMYFIKQDAQRGSDMIRDFVNNEFLESSQVSLQKERMDITAKIGEVMDSYIERHSRVAKQFKLVIPEKPIFMYIDQNKLMQVINNLVSNSIKFTQDNGEITVTVEDRDGLTLISVADNGIGIPEDLQPYLFDKFTKARRKGIRGEKSVGMGMSIIRNIVELHGGSIWFESRENAGATFFIELPQE